MVRYVEGWCRAIASIAFPGLLLAACASPPVGSDSYLVPGTGTYRVGEPYEINGIWYYPAVDYNYDRTGMASWYGEEFKGRLTANGEIFNLNALTAAHTTLPLPSIVQVTNLENGRSLQLRINDRGPFVDGRLIDVSRRAAQLLGFASQGTAVVRVTVLKDESIAAAEEAMHSGPEMVAAASRPRRGRVYVAVSAPRRSAKTARAVEPQPVPAMQIAVAPARPPAEPPPGLARQTATAMLQPSGRNVRLPRYRFSLISRAEAAELPGSRAFARKPAAAASSAAVAKMPSLTTKLGAAPEGPVGQKIFVQTGAFAQRENAERAERRVSHWGSVHVTPISVKGVSMYRVRIGPLASEAAAKGLLARVVSDGYPEAHIVGD